MILASLKYKVQSSDKQKQLEKQGCVFHGQELLDNHELNINKKCYCNRPNKGKTNEIQCRNSRVCN